MKNFAAALLFTLALSAAAHGQTATPPPDAARDEAAIRAAIKSVEDGWNAHDGKAFAAPFAADADYVVVNGMHLKSREAIEQGHAQIFSTIYKDSRNAATVRSVRFIPPTWRWPRRVTGVRPRRTRKGRAVNMMVFTKENGRWSIAAFQNTPVQTQGGPPPPPGQSRP